MCLPYVMWSAHFFVTHIQTEKISSWNGPTFHVCCFMLGRIHTRDTGIRFANEGYKRNKEASGAVQTTIPVGDTYEILKSSRSAWSAASILLRIKRLM